MISCNRKEVLMKAVSLVVLIMLLSGCVSIRDFSDKDGTCVRECSTTYSECLSKFTLFPILHKNDCTSALNVCGSACPVKP